MKQWKKQFGASALERGYSYFISHEVRQIKYQDSQHEYFQALVNGSYYNHPYEVSGRYRKNGRVSELYCSCPWARKGHRCKHMAAVLYKIDHDGHSSVSETEENPESSIVDHLPYILQSKAKQAELTGDPLKIVSEQKFTENDYQDAINLQRQLNVANYYFDVSSKTNKLFHIEFKSGFLSFAVDVYFDVDQVQQIAIQSMIKNFNEQALKIIGLLKFVEYFIDDNPLEKTNQSARMMLELFKEQNEQQGTPIVLRAQIEHEYDEFYLTFRLGVAGHLYKVQNVANIVDYSRRSIPLKLGKFFNRQIDVAQMDENSQKWFHFIEELVDTNEVLADARNDYGYLSFKMLEITPMIADKLDQLQQEGVPLYDLNQKVTYKIKQTKLPIDIETDGQNQTAIVNIGEVIPDRENFLPGNNYFYYYDENVWTRYEGIDPNYLLKAGIFQNDQLVFGPDTIQVFGRKILPKLRKSNNFDIHGQDRLEDILPPEAKVVFQLDFRDAQIILKTNAKYGEREYQLMEKSTDDTIRDLEKEQEAQELIQKLGFAPENSQYLLAINASNQVDKFFDNGINQLKELGQVKATASFKRLLGNLKTKVNLSLGIRLSNNTLDLTVTDQQLDAEDVQAILNAYQEKRHYFLLKNGEMRKVDSPSMETLASVMKKLGVNLKQFVKGKMAIPAYRAFYLEKLLQSRDNLAYMSNSAFDKLIQDIDKGTTKKALLPKALQNILRPYQKQGFEWLSTLLNYNLGALLADEMGLGKTLQTIAVLLARKNQTKLPSLVVAPASVIYNWESEIEKFAPELKTKVLGGTKKQRMAQLADAKNEILITSYDSLKRDIEDYQNLQFDLEIIDEAQNIKNAKTAVAKAVKVIKAGHRIALTGTPIENNLSELWSIFDYLMPGFLGEYQYFRDNYEKPIVKDGNEEAEKDLSQIIAPFILRRLKKDVLKDLPDKNEEVVYVKMTGKQEQLYQAQTQKLLDSLNKQDDLDFKKQRFEVLAAITKLRELCCDPHLLYANYRGKSAKLEATLELIQESLAAGHKILLFSQFTSMLDIVKEKLNKLKIDNYLIVGSTPKQKRQELIQKFNELDHSAVFLISLKAGGTGINLTSADVVIHLDPWWNVAAENQATDRVHRIGQKHDVQIYKMVAQHTIEEKIIELQQVKSKLAEAILNGKNVGSSSLSREDLVKILER